MSIYRCPEEQSSLDACCFTCWVVPEHSLADVGSRLQLLSGHFSGKQSMEVGGDCESHSYSNKELRCLNHVFKPLDAFPGPVTDVPRSPKL